MGKPRDKKQKQRKGGAGGDDRPGKRRKKGEAPKRMDIDLPADAVEDELDISDEDVEFVKTYGKQINFLTNLDKAALDKSVKDRQSKEVAREEARQKAAARAALAEREGREDDEDESDEDEEDEEAAGGDDGVAAYEKAPRYVDKSAEKERKSRGLPIKTLDGQVLYQPKDQQDPAGRAKGGKRGAQGEEAEEDGAGALPLASKLGIQVAGVTIEDELEADQKLKAEVEKRAKADSARKQREEQKQQQQEQRDREEAATGVPAHLAPALRSLKDQAQRRQALREAMAVAAQKLLAGPEDNVGELRTLLTLGTNDDPQISRLALLSLLAVFKDIIPGYRIRLPSAEELKIKVSKDVQKVRDYESTLLRSYQSYLKLLLAALQPADGNNSGKGKGGQQGGKGKATDAASQANMRIAVKCMCQLLMTQPHFNYTSDLLQAVVPRATSRDPEVRSQCCEAVRQLLQADVEGGVSLEAVQLVADLVKKRKCNVHPDVVRALSVLTFPEVRRESSEDQEKPLSRKKLKQLEKKAAKKPGKKAAMAAKSPGMPAAAVEAMKQQQQQSRAIRADVERSFKEAEAGPDAKLMAHRQSQMLEALFEIYFRVLKHCTASGLAALEQDLTSSGGAQPGTSAGAASTSGKGASAPASATTPGGTVGGGLGWSRDRVLQRFPLLYPALEGLARYTHLVSVEYFNDLMEVFKQLLRSPTLPLVERLRLLLTASDILRGQGEALTIDRRDFYVRLYEALALAPYRQLGEAEGKDEDDASDPPLRQSEAATGQESISVLLASTAQQMLCDPKMSDMARVAAFAKRCSSTVLGCDTGDAMALLGAVLRLMRRYPRLQSMMDYEGEAPVGGRTYDPHCVDPSEAGALAATLWELPLAAQHYHPHVAQAATSILNMTSSRGGSSGPQLSGPLAMPGTTRDLAVAYDTSHGAFRPAPPVPKAARAEVSGGMMRKLLAVAAVPAVTAEMQSLLKRIEPGQGTGTGTEEEELAVLQHYRVLRRYVRNQELRREKRVLEEKLRLFNEHLQDKAKQQPAASKQQAGNKQQQSRANAAAAPAAAPAAKKAKVA